MQKDSTEGTRWGPSAPVSQLNFSVSPGARDLASRLAFSFVSVRDCMPASASLQFSGLILLNPCCPDFRDDNP
jgi:hypothetical protein